MGDIATDALDRMKKRIEDLDSTAGGRPALRDMVGAMLIELCVAIDRLEERVEFLTPHEHA